MESLQINGPIQDTKNIRQLSENGDKYRVYQNIGDTALKGH